ncbi:MAG: DDE-type integrase/transposase/recombinase [Cucumibacter sp.]
MRSWPQWQWYLDEVFVLINGETRYLWRAVDHEGEVFEAFVSKRRDRNAALKFLKKLMKRYGAPRAIVTDKLRSYGAAMKHLGTADRQRTGRWLNNRAENSHLPFRRRERPCSTSDECKVWRSLPPFAPPSTTTSTRNATSTAATSSNKTVPPPLLSGVNSAPPNSGADGEK